ncbi:hypothetical protein [Lederbergia galactosidilytica]|uniref:hypothetical protein n=1 Tax=Lederbergia galactosidilytica TaxID=217031 RepID=UPI000B154A52
MNKIPLLTRLLNMERDYVRLFSKESKNEGVIAYIDSQIPDMYTHNFTLYECHQGLIEFIHKEIDKEETKEKGFFRLETSLSIGDKKVGLIRRIREGSIYYVFPVGE